MASPITATIRRIAPALLASLCALLVLAPRASATINALTATPQSPMVGELVTVEADVSSECTNDVVWKVDGQDPPAGSQSGERFDSQANQVIPYLKTTFTTPGSHTVTGTNSDFRPAPSACGTPPATSTKSITINVSRTIGGSITSAPDPPVAGRETTIGATVTGGSAPYSYAWDSDNDGAFDDEQTRTFPVTWTGTTPRTVRVRIRDGATPFHESIVTRTLTPKVATTPQPPAPPPCVKKVAFALSEFTTNGCFTTPSPGRYETTASLKLNGMAFSDSGQKFVITRPTTAQPGGHLTASDTAITLGEITPFSGDIDWDLPAGKAGEEGELHTVTVPPVVDLFGLPVGGTIAIRLGLGTDGKHYAVLPLNVQLPAIFTPGPNRAAGRVTGSYSLRVDDAGPHYDGLKIEVADVWVGRIRVPEACFSYIPAGGQNVAPCPAPSLDGEPYITCADDSGTERWDGNAVLELPVASAPQFAAFGGIADGKLSKLGGFADNLGFTIPILPGVYLKRIGAGICLNPPPLKIRGDVGVEALGGKLRINGNVLYSEDSVYGWTLRVGGNASVADVQLGQGSLEFNPWGDIDFDVSTSIDLLGTVTIDGEVSGWLQPRNSLFNIEGSVKGCLDKLCATTYALVSSTGLAGCLDAGTIVVYEPTGVKQGSFGFGSLTFTTTRREFPLKAGFGYVFGSGEVDLLGGSCDFAAYRAEKPEEARAAGVAQTIKIAAGEKAVSLRIHGSKGPPKIVLRGPDGTTITSPANAKSAQVKGRWLLAENKTDGTTSVLLVDPKAGDWTIDAAPGAASSPTKVDRAAFEEPPVLLGRIRRASGGRRQLTFGYAVPKGATVTLVERAKGIAKPIAKRVNGAPCKGAKPLPGGRTLRCVTVSFTPSRGPGGKRRVEAVVTRDGLPLAKTDIASFTAPKETLPSRPGPLRARRVKGSLIVAFPPSRGASRYTASAVLSDGRRLGFDLKSKCRALKIPSVPKSVSAKVRIAGLRYDLRTGKYRDIRIGKRKTSAGPKGKLPKKACR